MAVLHHPSYNKIVGWAISIINAASMGKSHKSKSKNIPIKTCTHEVLRGKDTKKKDSNLNIKTFCFPASENFQWILNLHDNYSENTCAIK